jgi:hypothetical protein
MRTTEVISRNKDKSCREMAIFVWEARYGISYECLVMQVARSSGKNRCFARANMYHSLLRTVTCVPNL